ncbi:MAG: hypothetical protein LBR74_10535 [Eubacterium sp.]|jgi:hypothetical protein|nr:hypothetical protein [Eubacterium sp.]
MCLSCDRDICPQNCPEINRKEIYVCAECLEGIVEGEIYAEIDFSCYHKACLEAKPLEDLLELFGCELHKAGLYI